MTDKNSHKFRQTIAANDHIKKAKHPRQIHGLELGSEPKIDDGVFVQLAPYVHDGKNHEVHENLEIENEPDDDAAQPVKKPHERVIRGTTVEQSGFQPRRIGIEKVEVYEIGEARHGADGVVEDGGKRAPYLKLAPEIVPA